MPRECWKWRQGGGSPGCQHQGLLSCKDGETVWATLTLSLLHLQIGAKADLSGNRQEPAGNTAMLGDWATSGDMALLGHC